MNRQEIADQLEIELSNAAEWRREKAIEHPQRWPECRSR
jgi:hypothetical protein